jgi:hypothetical protein
MHPHVAPRLCTGAGVWHSSRKMSASASPILLSAALAGLLGIACSSSDEKHPVTPGGAAITSSVTTSDMTLEKFTTECDAMGGQIETHPSCHGQNTCKGMSYDTGTLVLTEHTCMALNTCSGYSCVVPMDMPAG